MLNSLCVKYFQSQHKAIQINDTIFLKGMGQSILRIKKKSDDEYIDLDVQSGNYLKVPSGGQCILSELSPFYRCNYYEASLVGENL